MDLQKFKEMLRYKRPAFSDTETEFIQKFIFPANKNLILDGYGNIIVDTCKNPTIIFSCHTDTVDRKDGFREIFHDELMETIFAVDDILGADDCAGVFLMLAMIEKNIPGRYIFHRAEEIGALGASWILENTPNLLYNIEHAIAFDRRGSSDVITHMFIGETCSHASAMAISDLLGDENYTFSPTEGVFTDTMIYCGHVKNCTNVSVGYYDEHTKNEFIDLIYFQWLVNRVTTIDWQSL